MTILLNPIFNGLLSSRIIGGGGANILWHISPILAALRSQTSRSIMFQTYLFIYLFIFLENSKEVLVVWLIFLPYPGVCSLLEDKMYKEK